MKRTFLAVLAWEAFQFDYPGLVVWYSPGTKVILH